MHQTPFPEAISFLRNPLGILRPVKHLLHISHMRGYTSLLGHILGSNPEVEGYYELHIGYHSARSLLRQKLLYYKEHKPKRQPSYILDKVLHNEHRTEPAVLQRKNVVTIISIREPGPTVASILKHFRRVSPGHAYCDPDYALKYYCNRITKLAELAESVSGRYAYMDARVLVERPADALNDLSEWLALNTPLTQSYHLMKNTSRGNTGDHSSNIRTGIIQRRIESDIGRQVELDIDAGVIGQFEYVRDRLVRHAGLIIAAQ